MPTLGKFPNYCFLSWPLPICHDRWDCGNNSLGWSLSPPGSKEGLERGGRQARRGPEVDPPHTSGGELPHSPWRASLPTAIFGGEGTRGPGGCQPERFCRPETRPFGQRSEDSAPKGSVSGKWHRSKLSGLLGSRWNRNSPSRASRLATAQGGGRSDVRGL